MQPVLLRPPISSTGTTAALCGLITALSLQNAVQPAYSPRTVSFVPYAPGKMYVCTERDGLLYLSGANTFSPSVAPVTSFPFRTPHRVFFDPNDPGYLRVTTFGNGLVSGHAANVSAVGRLKVMLDGPYDSSTQLMKDDLRVAGLVPATEPYSALGFAQVGGGGEVMWPGVLNVTGNNAIVDWVQVELRNSGSPATVVATRCALLQRDGDVVEVDGVSTLTFPVASGAYYLAVRHRNHFGAMTVGAITLTGSTTTIDFTDTATLTCGTAAQKTVGTRNVLWAGNTLRDTPAPSKLKYTGASNDRDVILVAIGGTVPTNTIVGYRAEDVNMDGTTKYTGTDNDRDPILVNIGGTVPTNTLTEQLP